MTRERLHLHLPLDSCAGEPFQSPPHPLAAERLQAWAHGCGIRIIAHRLTRLKKWSRAKKIALIDRLNPSWLDLSIEILQVR